MLCVKVKAADALEAAREAFEKEEIFSERMINGIIEKLRSYNDANLRAETGDSQEKMLALVRNFWHCG